MKTIKYLICLLALTAVRANAQSTLEVWMDQTQEVTADGTTVTYLTFYQKDPNVNYIAFNMAITVPKGIHINQKKVGRDYVNDIELSVRATTTHTISCNMPDENTIKIISTSSELQEFYPDDEDGNLYDPLFSIGLVGDASMYNGKYPIEMWDMVFGYRDQTDGQLKHNDPEPIFSQMNVTGGQDFAGIDYTLSSLKWGTLILPFEGEIPSGLTAYTCEGIDENNKLVLNRQSSFHANTPYIISGTPGNYHLNGTYCAVKDTYSTDHMTGVYVETEVPQNAFVLQNHEETSGIGFYRVGATAVNCPAYRCYLNPLSVDTKMLSVSFDDCTTGINSDKADTQTSPVYSINGKYVGKDNGNDNKLNSLQRGVYIMKQKKIIKK
ncbi:MAG: hypothetical protein ACI4BA_04355 [Prevotella sp.]